MRSRLTFDELNTLVGFTHSTPYKRYFEDMDLSESDREKRIELAESLEDKVLFVLYLLFVMRERNTLDWETARKRLEDGYIEALSGYMEADSYTRRHAEEFSRNVIAATKANADDMYSYSLDRAMFISENESNLSWNYQEFAEAVGNGKTRKRWIDVRDKRERDTHRAVGGSVKNIEEPFNVGGSLMMFPKDTSLGADSGEIINCRCTIKYF